jgi:hypothetical protein
VRGFRHGADCAGPSGGGLGLGQAYSINTLGQSSGNASRTAAQGAIRGYTKADLRPNAIGDSPDVADHVRCAGYSDRAHVPFARVCLLG